MVVNCIGLIAAIVVGSVAAISVIVVAVAAVAIAVAVAAVGVAAVAVVLVLLLLLHLVCAMQATNLARQEARQSGQGQRRTAR